MDGHNVTALLGPTNTGKTHHAIQRMIAHGSGMIGLPLRLLAREVYARVVDQVGEAKVALLTGEEKIIPPHARYWVCTVEAMPGARGLPNGATKDDVKTDFLAIDEVQLCSDLERGHVFTDRVLNRRGLHETLLLGSDTAASLLQKLLPGLQIEGRARLSTLTYTGSKKISRLPPKSAVVAFSASEVYAIAELIRRQKGGAAVVMGALSPRTRNAQVALYQAGEVQHLVATDAIGMGLNLDVNHIAFAGSRKFDGFHYRNLNPAELGQIAGRAGRYKTDGTFGVTGRQEEFELDLVQQLEAHDFAPVKQFQWRASALDFSNPRALVASLEQMPPSKDLTRSPLQEDQSILEAAMRDPRFATLQGRGDVERLWEVCQIPDYRKLSLSTHAELCLDIGGYLLKGDGRLPHDWLNAQIEPLQRTEGDIDTLQARLASIRIWTFVANRSDWVHDPAHWRSRARALEDQLSDALHERLMQRFIDRRTSVLARRLRDQDMLETQISENGIVAVEGETIGTLNGFRFVEDAAAEGGAVKTLRAAAAKVVSAAILSRAQLLAEAPNDQFILSSDNHIRWKGQDVARLVAGTSEIEPDLKLNADEHLTGSHREWVEARLKAFLRHSIATPLKPVIDLKNAESLTGMARGLAFQLVESLGILDRAKVADDVKALDQTLRGELRKLGVRFGAHHLYMPLTLKPKPRALAAQLWLLKRGQEPSEAIDKVLALALSGRTTWVADTAIDADLYRVLGYKVLGTRAVRVDILERLADLIRPLTSYNDQAATAPPPEGRVGRKGFTLTPPMTSLLGSSPEDMGLVLRALGYVSSTLQKPEVDDIARKSHDDYAIRIAKLDASKSETPTMTETGETAQNDADKGANLAKSAPSETEKSNEINESVAEITETSVQGSLQNSASSTPETPAIADIPDVSREIEDADVKTETADSPSVPPAQTAEPTEPELAVPTVVEVWHFPRKQFEKRGHKKHHRPSAANTNDTAAVSDTAERKPFRRDFKKTDGKTPEAPAERRHQKEGDRKPFNKDRKPFDKNRKPFEKQGREHQSQNRMVFSTEDKSTANDANNPFAALAALKSKMTP